MAAPGGIRLLTTNELIRNAWRAHVVVPALNIPYIPMVAPVVRALRDTRCFGLVQVARPEIMKFESRSLKAVRDEYAKHGDERFTRLHLDHVPVIDEDNLKVDYEGMIREAIALGYQSVMVDGSRLSLQDNIAATRRIVTLAHASGIPAEAELGAVLGHEAGPIPPYEELFATGKGFTDPAEAGQFVKATGVDWLSAAIGNIHGAVALGKRSEKKVEARLNIAHLDRIAAAVGVPLVLHGGSGIRKEYIWEGIRHGIAKINVGTAIRQPYEAHRTKSIAAAQDAVYAATVQVIREELNAADTIDKVHP